MMVFIIFFQDIVFIKQLILMVEVLRIWRILQLYEYNNTIAQRFEVKYKSKEKILYYKMFMLR